MLRKALIALLLAAIALAALTAAAGAQGFDPATQSHEGACARETVNVAQAVHDYAANGVLADFAQLLGIHGSAGSLGGKMRRQLVVARVRSRVVTANHGCDGQGHWFAVGPRTLYAGEQVGVSVPGKLRSRLCLGSHRGCKRLVLKESVVLPITCWNPNLGSVSVVLYVRVPKPKHTVKPAKEVAAPTPTPPAPTPPAPTPVADPAAVAAQQQCSEGAAVVVTLSNGTSATAPASFVVNGVSHGPILAGASEKVTIAPASPGSSVSVTVVSGSSTLIDAESFMNTCVPKPAAKATFVEACQQKQDYDTEYEVELTNEASATWPATFKLEWTGPEEKLETAEYGPLAPGKTEKVFIVVGPPPSPGGFEGELKVSSAGSILLEEKIAVGC